jgi:tRNA C32,U32 (ribose-2'-O)-methylase TrmJ
MIEQPQFDQRNSHVARAMHQMGMSALKLTAPDGTVLLIG